MLGGHTAAVNWQVNPASATGWISTDEPIELVELREAFAKARPIVLKFARAEAGTAELKQSSA
jgi:hypothetical protein